MARTQSSEEHCQATVLKLPGDCTTLRIIDFLRTKELRFTELQRGIGDENTVTLSSRLNRLESAGLLDRREATVDRQSVVDRLTSLGKGLLPVLREIQRFTHRSFVPASGQFFALVNLKESVVLQTRGMIYYSGVLIPVRSNHRELKWRDPPGRSKHLSSM